MLLVWARYQLSLKGWITITKTFTLPQFTYIASVLDPTTSTYDEINRIIGLFINTGTTKPINKMNWIHKDILYGPKNEGGLNFIDAWSSFLSLKISWVKRYASDALDDH